ncbi:Uncharacterised protein [Bordetella trematum]|nr:Uncharacterised protein [Bordetella trematum]VDH07585.1 Uncharacterised protein [Bordetella trematum]
MPGIAARCAQRLCRVALHRAILLVGIALEKRLVACSQGVHFKVLGRLLLEQQCRSGRAIEARLSNCCTHVPLLLGIAPPLAELVLQPRVIGLPGLDIGDLRIPICSIRLLRVAGGLGIALHHGAKGPGTTCDSGDRPGVGHKKS